MSKYMKLLAIQTELNVPKRQNKGVQYWSRSKEDILASVKPLLLREKALINLSDKIETDENGNKTMVTTAKIIDAESGEVIQESVGYCDFIKPSKFMDEAKVSGACSSYAGKFALCNLLGVDGQADHDYILPQKDEENTVSYREMLDAVVRVSNGNEDRTKYILGRASVSELGALNTENIPSKLIESLYRKWVK